MSTKRRRPFLLTTSTRAAKVFVGLWAVLIVGEIILLFRSDGQLDWVLYVAIGGSSASRLRSHLVQPKSQSYASAAAEGVSTAPEGSLTPTDLEARAGLLSHPVPVRQLPQLSWMSIPFGARMAP